MSGSPLLTFFLTPPALGRPAQVHAEHQAEQLARARAGGSAALAEEDEGEGAD